MKTFVTALLGLALVTLTQAAAQPSTGERFKTHVTGLCDALSAYSAAINKHPDRIEHSRKAVAIALLNWKVTHQRLVTELVEGDPQGASQKIYRMRTATALDIAVDGLSEKDFEAFRTDSAIKADWLYVKSLIDFGKSLTYGTTQPR